MREGLEWCGFISQKVFIKSFCESQFPHKSVNVSFIITDIKNELTDLCGNSLLQNNFINTFCEIRVYVGEVVGPGRARLGRERAPRVGISSTVFGVSTPARWWVSRRQPRATLPAPAYIYI